MRVSRNQVTLLSAAVATLFAAAAMVTQNAHASQAPDHSQNMRMQSAVVSQSADVHVISLDKSPEQTILITSRPAFLLNADLRVMKVKKAPKAYHNAKYGSGHNLARTPGEVTQTIGQTTAQSNGAI
jgi:hypothetical protein